MPVHVLLVDPNRARRQSYEDVLKGDVVVTSLGDANEAQAVPLVEVAVIALRQTTGHGLELGRAIKAKHRTATVVVYGKVEGSTPATKLKERWAVDLHMPFLPPAGDIAALVETVRLAQQRVVAAEAARTRPAATRSSSPGWGELLREPITSETIKTLLKKDVFGR